MASHNKRQQSDSEKLSPFALLAQKLPFLPRRCAGRYTASSEPLISNQSGFYSIAKAQ
jgi:hypothetical protein